jgi:putative FmdB family regulatory protein
MVMVAHAVQPVKFSGVFCYDPGKRMPIYDYACRGCGQQFELLVRAGTVEECPSCQSRDLERLLSSGFAVSSEGTRQSHLQAARRKHAASSDLRDKRIAEAEEIREHSPPMLPPPKRP